MDPSLGDAFEQHGAVVVRGLLDDAWIDTLRTAAVDILDRAHAPGERIAESRARGSDGMWRWCEPFARTLFKSPIADAAAVAMGSRTIRLYEDLFLYTDPAVPGAPWHRDAPHWPVAGRQLSSVWFSLEVVTHDTGALRFVAGSHHDGDAVKAEGLYPVVDDASERRPIICFETEPGDAVVFHPRLLHSANGAAPDHPRRTFTIRFAGDDVRWRPRRSFYHPWMQDIGLSKGDVLDHPWFPVIRPMPSDVTPNSDASPRELRPSARPANAR